MEVPRKGVLSTFYCREVGTIEGCFAAAKRKHPGSIPDNHKSLANTGWVSDARCMCTYQAMYVQKCNVQ